MRHPASTLSTADAALWAALEPGVASLPQAVPAGLCELPLARMSRYEPKVDTSTGRLPEEEWVHVHRVRALTGQWYAVRIAGDAALGLPRAGDWPVLMAVVRLFEEAGWASNTLADVSIRRLLATMGVTGGGKMIRRVRDALVRFAQVRLLVVPIAPTADPAAALAALPAGDAEAEAPNGVSPNGPAGAQPSAPALWAPGRVTRRAERGSGAGAAPDDAAAGAGRGLSTGVLDVVWRDDTIERITLAEAWRPREGVPPTAWLDFGVYFGLGDPVAQRLYQLYAGAVARGEPAPLEHNLDWLRSALGLSARFKPSRVHEYLSAAFAELRAADVLADVVVEPPARGAAGGGRVVAMPGPVLLAAQLFAGLTLDVPRDVRVLLAVLQRLGVHRAEAERLLRTDPAQTYEVVCWVLWAQRHEPESIRDPGPYVRKAVAEGYRFAKPAYLRWRAGLQTRSLDLVRARAERAAVAGAPSGAAGDVSGDVAGDVAEASGAVTAVALGAAAEAAPAAPRPAAVASPEAAAPNASPAARDGAAYAFPGADADAAALWAGVCDALRRRAEPRQLRLLWVTTQLHLVAGARLEGDTLVCATPDLAMRAWAAGAEGRALLGGLAAELTGGAVTAVVARVPGDVARASDAA